MYNKNNVVEEIYESMDETLKQEANAASFMVGILEATVKDSLQNKDVKVYASNILAQLFSCFPVMDQVRLVELN